MIAQTEGIFLAYTSVFLETMKASERLSGLAGKITKDALTRAFKTIKNGGPYFYIYKDGDPQEDRTEDEGRTAVKHVPGLPEKVYAKLEDYGDPETWDDIYPPEVAAALRAVDMKRHKLTVMFASDY